jgi:hypothetical protein
MVFPAILIPVGKGILMGLGGLTILGSVASLAQKRGGRDVVDLDAYAWKDANGDMVDWDELEDYEQAEYLDNVMDGSVEL